MVKIFYKVAGVAQLVEHNLAKVGVVSSNLISRFKAEWQNGDAMACKAINVGSIPTSA